MRATIERLLNRYPIFAMALTALAIVALSIEAGFDLRSAPGLRAYVIVADDLLVGLVVLDLVAHLVVLGTGDFVRTRWFDLLLVVPALLLLAFGMPRGAGALIIARQLVVAGRLMTGVRWARRIAQRIRLRPVQVLALSFAATILFGAFLLTFPAATTNGKGADFVTALFTSTSAVCVTGLVVVDTGRYFAPFGQTVILLLIQIGGLGIMTLSSALALLFSRGMGFRQQGLMQEILEENSVQAFQDLVRSSVLVTLFIESVGALVLFVRFLLMGTRPAFALWDAVFHSVSAFCNAGFSLYTDSLSRFVGDPTVNITICGLIILGGLGFTVVVEVAGRNRGRSRESYISHLRHMTVHTKLTLLTTAILLISGTILFFFLEFDRSLAGLPLGSRLWASFFQSTTMRTCGFNTVDISKLGAATFLFAMVFMFIGGSSGSTAGGIKTTTAAVLALSVRSMLTGRSDIEIFGRRIPKQVLYRSIAITFISIVLVVVFLMMLLHTQHLSFTHLAFEAVSAFGTVGLSAGATPKLTTIGRLLIISLMFIGRTGPLTLALAVGERVRGGRFAYPEEGVSVG